MIVTHSASLLIIMVAVQIVLVIALAVSTNAYLLSQYCTQETVGTTQGIPLPLSPVTLAAGIADWQVTIPTITQCPTPLGLKATVCDFDKTPAITYATQKLIAIHRTGSLVQEGSVEITLYCPIYQSGVHQQELNNPLVGNPWLLARSGVDHSVLNPSGVFSNLNGLTSRNGVPSGVTSVSARPGVTSLNSVPTGYPVQLEH